MAEVFSGFVIGYTLSLLFTALAAMALLDLRQRSPYLARAIAPNLNFIMLSVPVSILAFLLWTAFGMMMGLIYRAAESAVPAGALGSPNGAFTVGVVVAGLALLGTVYYAFEKRPPWRVIGFVAVAVSLFGWAMPYLSHAAKFD